MSLYFFFFLADLLTWFPVVYLSRKFLCTWGGRFLEELEKFLRGLELLTQALRPGASCLPFSSQAECHPEFSRAVRLQSLFPSFFLSSPTLLFMFPPWSSLRVWCRRILHGRVFCQFLWTLLFPPPGVLSWMFWLDHFCVLCVSYLQDFCCLLCSDELQMIYFFNLKLQTHMSYCLFDI